MRDQYAELHRVARRRGQRGYFTTAQAEASGMSRTQRNRLVGRGLIVRCASGVYRFRIAAIATWKDLLAAELLATGGVASGLSAAALYELADPPARPSVIVERGRRTPAGRHSTRELQRYECVTVEGLRTLAPMRAVLDSAHLLSRSRAVAFVERAIVRGLVKPEVLRRRCERACPREATRLCGRLARSRRPASGTGSFAQRVGGPRRPARQGAGLDLPHLEYELFFDGHRYIADAASALQRRDDRTFRQVARAIDRREANGPLVATC